MIASAGDPVGTLMTVMILTVYRLPTRGDDPMDNKRFAHDFYVSRAWTKCRNAYRTAQGGLCERCAAAGLIVPGDAVHHKIRLTPDNIDDPNITLNWDNLILLCASCHEKEHRRPKRWKVDEYGHIEL